MRYKKKIEEYRSKIKNKRILKFVDFLDVIFDWIDNLYESKRLKIEQKEEIQHYMPTEIIKELDKISDTEISDEKYNELKGILLRDTSELINFIINIGELRMVDFDLMQFNLSQIFKKAEISAMVELARTHLSNIILEKRGRELIELKKKEKLGKEYLEKLRAMPKEELKKLVGSFIFDFKPRARTPEERSEAIKNNRRKMSNQREKFRNFERKLIDAIEEEGKQAQSRVYKQIGDVKREVGRVREKFRKKAKEIVSPEGPKKLVRESRANILLQKEKIKDNVKGSRKNIFNKRDELEDAMEKRRGIIKKEGMVQINRGKHTIDLARKHMEQEKEDAENLFEAGRRHLAKGKKHLEKEKLGFINRKNGYEKRLVSLGASLTKKSKEEEERISLIRKDLLSLKHKGIIENARNKISKAGKGVSIKTVLPGKRDIKKGFLSKKEKLEKDLQHKKELIAYDTRFKSHWLQERAKKQKENMAEKLEGFQEKQRTSIARYRAGRKAHMIRTLLRAIRTMR